MKRENRLDIRFSEEEWSRLQELQYQYGFRTLQETIRALLDAKIMIPGRVKKRSAG